MSNSPEVSRVTRSGFVGEIPVNNIWLLMFYASELSQLKDIERFSSEKPPNSLLDFASKLLVTTVEKRIHKNLTLGFTRASRDLSRVRGKIDCMRTERKALLAKGRIACTYEWLHTDTPLNRYVLGALLKAGRSVGGDVANRCMRLAASLKEMGVLCGEGAAQKLLVSQHGYMAPQDRLMLSAAKLVHEMLLPIETGGGLSMQHADRDERWVRRLFEKAVGGFYKANLPQSSWQVSQGAYFRWQIERQTVGLSEILPRMKTDVVLEDRKSDRTVVIDTKFTSILKKGYRREKTLSSSYIYQMYTYLFSQAPVEYPRLEKMEGVLLHPSVGCDMDECVVIQGTPIRFITVDLAQDAAQICKRLIKITTPFSTW
jgi:5-methylcytosine-specific restriction enzyme subunit McrC